MRIDLNSIHPETPEAGQGVKSGSAADSATQPGGGLGASAAGGSPDSSSLDRVSLDQSGVQTLAAQAAQLPEIRAEKITALQQAIQSGSYRVPAEKIANAILAEIEARPAA